MALHEQGTYRPAWPPASVYFAFEANSQGTSCPGHCPRNPRNKPRKPGFLASQKPAMSRLAGTSSILPRLRSRVRIPSPAAIATGIQQSLGKSLTPALAGHAGIGSARRRKWHFAGIARRSAGSRGGRHFASGCLTAPRAQKRGNRAGRGGRRDCRGGSGRGAGCQPSRDPRDRQTPPRPLAPARAAGRRAHGGSATSSPRVRRWAGHPPARRRRAGV
jgi:hypothetical protein